MYDTLLDELEDDRTPSAEEAVDLADKTADVDDDDDPPDDVACVALDTDDDAEAKSDDALVTLSDDHESWSDDPVRMYLTQMGEIPLLTRQAGNHPGQADRNHPRRVPPQAAGLRLRDSAAPSRCCKRVHRGELPFDRTVQVSVTDRLEKDQILGRLPHNLRDARNRC